MNIFRYLRNALLKPGKYYIRVFSRLEAGCSNNWPSSSLVMRTFTDVESEFKAHRHTRQRVERMAFRWLNAKKKDTHA